MTLNPAIQEALSAFRDEIQSALGDNLIAVYVDGSLTMGDFEPASSDLDFLVVIRDPLGAAEVERVADLHRRLTARSVWGGRLEGEYAEASRLRPWGIDGPAIGVEPGGRLRTDVVDQFTAENVVAIRDHGVAIHGPRADVLLPPVDRVTLTRALRAYLVDLIARPSTEDVPTSDLASQVLNVARCLYSLRTGYPCTKTDAATWLARQAPALESVLLAARAVRRGDAQSGAEEVLRAECDRVRDAARRRMDEIGGDLPDVEVVVDDDAS